MKFQICCVLTDLGPNGNYTVIYKVPFYSLLSTQTPTSLIHPVTHKFIQCFYLYLSTFNISTNTKIASGSCPGIFQHIDRYMTWSQPPQGAAGLLCLQLTVTILDYMVMAIKCVCLDWCICVYTCLYVWDIYSETNCKVTDLNHL